MILLKLIKFQFQIGAIKGYSFSNPFKGAIKFQFQIGAIKGFEPI